jgi:hypothetical protein
MTHDPVQSPRIFKYNKMSQPLSADVVNESTGNHFTVPYLVPRHGTVLCYVCQTDADGRKQTTDESNQSILPKQAYCYN